MNRTLLSLTLLVTACGDKTDESACVVTFDDDLAPAEWCHMFEDEADCTDMDDGSGFSSSYHPGDTCEDHDYVVDCGTGSWMKDESDC